MLTLREQQVTVDRLNLISILKTNRAKHASDYEKAVEDWKDALKAETAALAAKTAGGDFSDIKIESRRPQESLNSYDEVIEMLELSVDDKITLDRGSFCAYVKDEWAFKSALASLTASNAGVTAKYSVPF